MFAITAFNQLQTYDYKVDKATAQAMVKIGKRTKSRGPFSWVENFGAANACVPALSNYIFPETKEECEKIVQECKHYLKR